MDLNGRRVLVTGASRGIGADLARHFAAAGAEVALVARSAEPIEKLAADLGGRAYPADLADRTVLADLHHRIELDGPIDVLVNNAGVEHTGPLGEADPDDIDGLLDLNLHTPIQLSRLALPGMRQRRCGPTARSVARFERLRLLVNLESADVAAATVQAVRRDRRHVRLPNRSAALPMLAELPRRITELLLAGVDHHTT
jgi:NAD(P)-dependent dehydrogenase (short-subunit alcohol dehydrogenase family)